MNYYRTKQGYRIKVNLNEAGYACLGPKHRGIMAKAVAMRTSIHGEAIQVKHRTKWIHQELKY